MDNLSAVERAFQIARAGAVASVDDIKRVLRKEGHWETAIEGQSIRRQLARLIKQAREAKESARRNET